MGVSSKSYVTVNQKYPKFQMAKLILRVIYLFWIIYTRTFCLRQIKKPEITYRNNKIHHSMNTGLGCRVMRMQLTKLSRTGYKWEWLASRIYRMSSSWVLLAKMTHFMNQSLHKWIISNYFIINLLFIYNNIQFHHHWRWFRVLISWIL